MQGKITFTIIKPRAMSRGHAGDILAKIHEAGFWIAGLKMLQLSKLQAEEFYGIHRERPFFNDLVEFMTSGPIVVAVLEKENAVEDYRNTIGATDPTKADAGTIRKLFAESIQENAVHGSDSDENARTEACFFFGRSELFSSDGGYLF